MLLNAKIIIDDNLLKLENSQGKPAQIGYDVSLKSVKKIGGAIGMVLKNKTILNTYTDVKTTRIDNSVGYLLYPGTYEFTFHEGLNTLPAGLSAKLTQRSSLSRNGAFMESSWFDPGFGTDNIGTTLNIMEPIFIEQDARVAQIVFKQNVAVAAEELYDGQWQNDKQRVNTSK